MERVERKRISEEGRDYYLTEKYRAVRANLKVMHDANTLCCSFVQDMLLSGTLVFGAHVFGDVIHY